MSVGEVTPEDREHAKRIVYSVVYGAGEYQHASPPGKLVLKADSRLRRRTDSSVCRFREKSPLYFHIGQTV